MKIRDWIIVGVALSFAPCLAAPRTRLSLSAAPQTAPQAGDTIQFGNAHIELVMDAGNGFLRNIVNHQTHIEHKTAADGSWPFRIVAGRPVPMNAGNAQRMHYTLSDNANRLELVYDDLVDDSGAQTGIALRITMNVEPADDFVTISAQIDNRGSRPVTSFSSGDGELLTGDQDRSGERITIPGIGSNQRAGFIKRTLGYPPGLDLAELNREFPTVPDDQIGAGWLDYSGSRGGVGIGYVDPRGPAMVFQARSARPGGGMRLVWRLFDLEWGYWHNQLMNRATASVPLPASARLETGEWILAAHAGDWHRMADIYRQRYEKYYASDRRSPDEVPRSFRDSSLAVDLVIADQGGFNYIPEQGPGRKLYLRFADVPSHVQAIARQAGIPLRRLGVKIAGQTATTWSFPDFFPFLAAAGGDEGARDMAAALARLGAAYTAYYTNPWYNNDSPRHKDEPVVHNHIKDAVSGDSLNAARGTVACLDNHAWQRLWRDTLLPAYRNVGASGIYFDEGQVINEICGKKEPAAHRHGTDPPGVLGGPGRGLMALQRLAREVLGPSFVVLAEGANDVTGRWLDAWQYTEPASRYTHPEVIVGAVITDSRSLRQVHGALVNGAMLELAPGVAPTSLLARALAVREQLLESHAPGFPGGFRDTVGVRPPAGLVARAFREPGRGVTVVYYATTPVDGELQVDGRALDNEALGVQRKHMKLGAGTAGFWVPTAGRGR